MPGVDILPEERASREGVFRVSGDLLETLCPHLWRGVWNPLKPLQIGGFWQGLRAGRGHCRGADTLLCSAIAVVEKELGPAGWTNRLS